MASELIERMAKAIEDESSNFDKLPYDIAKLYVKAALKSAREPTEKIKNVVTGSIYYSAEKIWQSMLDKELEE